VTAAVKRYMLSTAVGLGRHSPYYKLIDYLENRSIDCQQASLLDIRYQKYARKHGPGWAMLGATYYPQGDYMGYRFTIAVTPAEDLMLQLKYDFTCVEDFSNT
jgi:hypothetical protein